MKTFIDIVLAGRAKCFVSDNVCSQRKTHNVKLLKKTRVFNTLRTIISVERVPKTEEAELSLFAFTRTRVLEEINIKSVIFTHSESAEIGGHENVFLRGKVFLRKTTKAMNERRESESETLGKKTIKYGKVG